MTGVDWASYEPFDPGVAGPWDELDRRAAQAVFDRVMHALPERHSQLEALLSRNGGNLHETDAAITGLESWLLCHVTPDPEDETRPRPLWLAVAFDIGLFVGSVMTRRRPELHWKLVTKPRSDVSYHRPVIAGFDIAMSDGYHVDPVLVVSGLAFRALVSREQTNAILKVLRNAKAGEPRIRRT